MNIKALLTTALVLGSSSLALAAPAYSAEGGVEVRDHRHQMPMPTPAPAPYWNHKPVLQTLAASTIGRNGRDMIWLGSTRLSSIKLQATRGRTQVSQVAIKFANGRSQIVYPNKTLQGQDSCIDIDLQGNARNVTSIVVYGRGTFRSSFQVLGA